MKYVCHKSSEVQSSTIGEGTTIWQFVVVLKEAKIGKNCNINCHVFIENDVTIGNNVTIKSGVQIWDGITLEDYTFIGPNVTFTNDLVPRSKQYLASFAKTVIKKGATIGANATIISGNEIGEYAFVGAGSVVTKNIGKHEVWYGNPAEKTGYISKHGDLLDLDLVSKSTGKRYTFMNNKLLRND